MVFTNTDEQMKWKEFIKQWGLELGFVAVGFAAADMMPDLAQVLQSRFESGLATPFESKDIQKRINPLETWRKCTTVAALAYPLPLTSPPQPGQGILSRSSVGRDYHKIVDEKLKALADLMYFKGWMGTLEWQVDTGPLVERAFAVRAGIGWIGRNQQLIIPGYGSFATLALMLLDEEIPFDEPVAFQCGECRRCVEACPAQIIGKEPFAAKHCVSYLTQSKEILDPDEQKRLGLRIFGCDTCQEVCQYNQKRIAAEQAGSCAGKLQCGVELLEILNLTKGEFLQNYKGTAASWRGKGVLQRNAFLALRNKDDDRYKLWQEERIKSGTLPLIIKPYI